ncbi:hypothetical protein IWW37_005496 [Coemansia sp. RSA 2050]|nr:hypothetical protein IWW37_005496 [Coemansia sp. RSA 2050]
MVGLILRPAALSSLPCDVVSLIVRSFYTHHVAQTACGYSVDTRFGHRLRRLVALAAVDTQWRHAAVPLLYRTLLCEERRSGGWRTNLSLFAGGAKAKTSQQWARHLLVLPLGGGKGLDTLAGQLRDRGMFSAGWCGLRQVSVVGAADDMVHKFYREVVVSIIGGDEFMQVSDADLQALSVVNASCVSMCLMNGHCAITDLCVRGGDSLALALVRRSAPALVSLRICDIAAEISLDLLSVLASPPAIFEGLGALALEFSDSSPGNSMVAEAGPFAMVGSFPMLRSLVIRHCPFDVRVCLAAAGGINAGRGRLSKLEVCGSRSDVLALAESQGVLPAARSVVLACVGVARPPVDRAERFVGSALGSRSLGGAELLSLTVIASRPVAFLGDGRVACAGRLRALELRVPLRLGAAESLLLQLPLLRRLCLPYIATEASLLSAKRPAGRVLSGSLQLLSMGFWDCRQDLRALSLAVLAFVRGIPSLRTLVHDTHVAVAVRRLIGGAGGSDHLRNLVITDHTKLSF